MCIGPDSLSIKFDLIGCWLDLKNLDICKFFEQNNIEFKIHSNEINHKY